MKCTSFDTDEKSTSLVFGTQQVQLMLLFPLFCYLNLRKEGELSLDFMFGLVMDSGGKEQRHAHIYRL